MQNSPRCKTDTILENISDKTTIRFPDESWDDLVQHPKCVALNILPVLDWQECRKRGWTDEQLKNTESDSHRTLVDNLDRVWWVDANDASALADVIEKYPTETLRGDIPHSAPEVVEFLRKGAFRIYQGYKEKLPNKDTKPHAQGNHGRV